MKHAHIPLILTALILLTFVRLNAEEPDINYTLWKTLKGHSDGVISVAFSPDGSLLASGSYDNTIKLWLMPDGECLKTLEGHSKDVNSATFSPDGSLLASGSGDNTIKLWSLPDGRYVQTLIGHSKHVRSVSFSPDGSLLASGSMDNTIKLWSMPDGRFVQTLKGHSHEVYSVSFCPDGSLLASGSYDNTIKLWSLPDGRLVRTLTGHSLSVNSASFSLDGSLLASGSYDHTIRLWSMPDGECLKMLKEHSDWVRSVSFNQDGSLLASGSDDHTIKLWSMPDCRCLRTLKGHSKYVMSVSFSPDGSLLASGGSDNTIKLWRLLPERELPPNLFAELDFKDENGNSILEASESAIIEITIINKGKGPAHRLEVTVEDDHPDPALTIGKEKIKRLNPDKSVDITIPLTTSVDLKSAEHRLKINVLEYFGYDMDPAYLLLSTQAYEPPQLIFSGMDIVDWGEETGAIVEDGQLQAGELVKAKLVVQNIGYGAFENTAYTVTSTDPNIYIEDGSGSLGILNAGEVKEFWVTISPNKRVTTTDKLPIYLTLTELVGKGNLENFQLPIRLNQKPPETKVVEVKPDLERIQRQIARFEYKSSKFKTRVKQLEDIWVVQPSRSKHPNSVAVVIGVEHYKHLPPAPYAVKDAELMQKYFKERLGVDDVVIYREDEVTGLVFDDLFNPDYGELQKAIIKGETELFVYYSGHGLPNKDGSEVYLFPSDGKVEQLEKLGYSLKKFYSNLNLLGARHTTVILDACFSGGSRSSGRIKEENLVAHKAVGLRIKEPWRQYPNFTIINSSTGAETSLGFDQSETGLFTYYLALGLQGKADSNNDRKVTTGELKEYVIRNVMETSKKISGLQTPQFYGDEDRVLVEW